MKRLLLAAIILLSGTFAFASGSEIWISSNTATADTTKVVCPKFPASRTGHGVFNAVCVNTGAAGTFTVYNSSASAINPFAAIDTTAKGCQRYDVSFSSGLT